MKSKQIQITGVKLLQLEIYLVSLGIIGILVSLMQSFQVMKMHRVCVITFHVKQCFKKDTEILINTYMSSKIQIKKGKNGCVTARNVPLAV